MIQTILITFGVQRPLWFSQKDLGARNGPVCHTVSRQGLFCVGPEFCIGKETVSEVPYANCRDGFIAQSAYVKAFLVCIARGSAMQRKKELQGCLTPLSLSSVTVICDHYYSKF